jgi:hypothetical protein
LLSFNDLTKDTDKDELKKFVTFLKNSALNDLACRILKAGAYSSAGTIVNVFREADLDHTKIIEYTLKHSTITPMQMEGVIEIAKESAKDRGGLNLVIDIIAMILWINSVNFSDSSDQQIQMSLSMRTEYDFEDISNNMIAQIFDIALDHDAIKGKLDTF